MAAEIEAKFILENEMQIDGLMASLRSQGFAVAPLPPVEIVDRYFDTPKWDLLRAGWAYRWREADGKRDACLKSAQICRNLVQTREELEQRVGTFPINGHALEDGPVAANLSCLGLKKPRELFQVQNHRQPFLVTTREGASIEVAFDRATITATLPPGRLALGKLSFGELELELKGGPEEALRNLADSLRSSLGLLPARLSKFERGLQTVGLTVPHELRTKPPGLIAQVPPKKRKNGSWKKSDPAIAYACHYLHDRLQRLLAEEPKAWEGLDPEGVHRMRVATRRTRAALRAFRSVLPRAERQQLDKELKWLAGVLGEVRDLDVLQEHCDRDSPEFPAQAGASLQDYRRYLAGRWREKREALIVALSSERYALLLRDFADLVQKIPGGDSAVLIREVAVQSLGQFTKRVLREGRAITEETPDEFVHSLRISCKRLRYLFEIFLPAYGKPLKGFARSLEELQDVLGEFQDACVAIEQLRSYAAHIPMQEENREHLLVVGELIHSQRLLVGAQRAGFHDDWKRFDGKGLRKKVLAVLR